MHIEDVIEPGQIIFYEITAPATTQHEIHVTGDSFHIAKSYPFTGVDEPQRYHDKISIGWIHVATGTTDMRIQNTGTSLVNIKGVFEIDDAELLDSQKISTKKEQFDYPITRSPTWLMDMTPHLCDNRVPNLELNGTLKFDFQYDRAVVFDNLDIPEWIKYDSCLFNTAKITNLEFAPAFFQLEDILQENSPLVQQRLGLGINDIQCKEQFVKIEKFNGVIACVKENSIDRLIERGWAI